MPLGKPHCDTVRVSGQRQNLFFAIRLHAGPILLGRIKRIFRFLCDVDVARMRDGDLPVTERHYVLVLRHWNLFECPGSNLVGYLLCVRCGVIFGRHRGNIGSNLRHVRGWDLRGGSGLIVLQSLQPRCVFSFDRSKLVEHLLSVRIRYVLGSVWSIVVLAVRYWDLFYRDWSDLVELLLAVRQRKRLFCFGSYVIEHLLALHARNVLGRRCSVVVHRVFGRQLRRVGGLIVLQSLRCGVIFCCHWSNIGSDLRALC